MTCTVLPLRTAVAMASSSTGIGREFAGLDRVVDARELLVHDPTRADVEVTDLGIAHLALRQADVEFGGVDPRVRIALQEARASSACGRARSRCRARPRDSRSHRG